MQEKIIEKKEIRFELTVKEIIHDVESEITNDKASNSVLPTFADCTWKVFGEIAKSGKVREFFKVGDKKETVLTNGEKVKIAIAGFNHDVAEDGKSIPVTLTFIDCLSEGYRMNKTSTNEGGWKSCEMRKDTMVSVFELLPNELQEIIVSCKKDSSTADKLFLPSEVEIFGTTRYSDDESKQYDFYKDKYNRIKFRTDNEDNSCWYWLRSPYSGYSNNFCVVSSDGSCDNNIANNSYGVAPCFAIS